MPNETPHEESYADWLIGELRATNAELVREITRLKTELEAAKKSDPLAYVPRFPSPVRMQEPL